MFCLENSSDELLARADLFRLAVQFRRSSLLDIIVVILLRAVKEGTNVPKIAYGIRFLLKYTLDSQLILNTNHASMRPLASPVLQSELHKIEKKWKKLRPSQRF